MLKPGVIIASEKMGAFNELNGCALNISNPRDLESVIPALHRGIQLVTQQQNKINEWASELARRVRKQNLEPWLQCMIETGSQLTGD